MYIYLHYIICVHEYMCITCIQCPWKPEEGFKSLGTSVIDNCKPLVSVLETKL